MFKSVGLFRLFSHDAKTSLKFHLVVSLSSAWQRSRRPQFCTERTQLCNPANKIEINCRKADSHSCQKCQCEIIKHLYSEIMNDAVGWKWVISHKGAYFSRLQIREFVYLNTLKCHHHEVVNGGPILNGTATRITSATRKMIGSLWIALLQSSRSKNKQEKGGKAVRWWRLLWRKSTLLRDVWKITPWIRKNIVISIHIGAMHCNKRYKSDKWGNGSTWAWNYTIALWQYVGHNYVGLIEGGGGGGRRKQ